ncbi:MAG: dockerin type I domain-containing protein [Oscillospiraceae bacterium]|nr:dockerin type I domain-containing protein [Oscillospiraceae bacterium]
MISGKKWQMAGMAVALVLAVVAAVLPADQVATALDDPVAVSGRLLSREATGDSSAWIEIAQYGGYSLLLRQEPITSSLTTYSSTLKDNTYVNSQTRKSINDWYNNKLSSNARLRDYAVTNDAMRVLGTIGAGYIDGMSLPTGGEARKGNDIAFALSYCEAALFCSMQYSKILPNGELFKSSYEARKNCELLLPEYVGAYIAPAYWLRTPGNTSYSAGCVAYTGDASEVTYGRAYQHTVTGTYAHHRPAIWVGSGIFGSSVTGKVWPMATDDLGLGSSFLQKHDVTVELRATFLTPAASSLSVRAVLAGDDGLGEFTFENVPPGEYVLYIKRPGYIARAMPVTIANTTGSKYALSPPGDEDMGVFRLWWGDCNDDLCVDGRDVMMIMELLAEGVDAFDARYNAACDMNADGVIDGRDTMMVYEMWNKIIWDYPGAESVDVFS